MRAQIIQSIVRAMTSKKAATAPRRLTPLEPKKEKRARELERVLIDCGYDYAEAMEVYATSLNAKDPDREECIKGAADRLSEAGAALSGAALALRDVPPAYWP